jgi:hypothetical protein
MMVSVAKIAHYTRMGNKFLKEKAFGYCGAEKAS